MLKSPQGQILLVSFVALCGPGMFNALSGLGAGGSMSSNTVLIDTANAVLYICSAIGGFFAGSVINKLGIRVAIAIGSLGYIVYVGSLWIHDREQNPALVIAAGFILGCCSSLFWCAQGAIMMSYPTEKQKGFYIAIFWIILNFGGIVGSLIALVINLNNTESSGVSNITYVILGGIMLIGTILSVFIALPTEITRKDGTPIDVQKPGDWKTELCNVVLSFKDKYMLYLIPAFLASNWFYSYQFKINAVYFNPTARAVNGAAYWGGQIFGSLLFTQVLDATAFSRRYRGVIAAAIVGATTLSIWMCGILFQVTFEKGLEQPMTASNNSFPFFCLLFAFYGAIDAIYQNYIYWLIGSFSNDISVLARYTGFYKSFQAIGCAASFTIDASNVSLLTECIVCFSILCVSSIPLGYITSQLDDTCTDKEPAPGSQIRRDPAQPEMAENRPSFEETKNEQRS